MNEQNETPKSMEEVAIQILCFSPGLHQSPENYVKDTFRDYLAQKFLAAHLEAETEEQRASIAKLWHSITGETFGR